MNLNKVIIAGNLTRDPEVKYTPKGTAVGNLSLAINDSYKDQDGATKESVTFIDIEVWGRQAELCKEYLAKGRPALIEGSLRMDQWEQDGQKRTRLKVKADRVQFGSNSAKLGADSKSIYSAPINQQSKKPELLGNDDEIPF